MLLMAVFMDVLFLIGNGRLHLALFGDLFADRCVHEYTVYRLASASPLSCCVHEYSVDRLVPVL